jgi:hypothetical protein
LITTGTVAGSSLVGEARSAESMDASREANDERVLDMIELGGVRGATPLTTLF